MNQNVLQGLRVLITRPEAQAGNWQQLLENAGASTLRTPLMAIVPIDASQAKAYQSIKNIVMDASLYQHGIFVSQNAAQYGLDWLEQYWPQMPIGLRFYAVGSATAKCLERAGYLVTAAGGTMNSEALLALPELQDLTHQRVVIFRGCGGRPLLGEVLRERGADVDYCELYERRFLSEGVAETLNSHQWGQASDLVTVHSGETLGHWQAILERSGQTRWKQLTLLVPGERVAARARESGFTDIVVAENASDACMLETLLNWRSAATQR